MYDDRNTTEIFHNIILHTHFLLNLYLILFFVVLHIPHNHKIQIQDKQSSQNKKGYRRGDCNTLVDEEDIGDFAFTQKESELFRRGSTVQSANLVQVLS